MRGRKKVSFTLILLVLLAGYIVWAVFKADHLIYPSVNRASLKSVSLTKSINWPKTGQSAVGINGTNILETNAPNTPKPTASTAKLITALVVLSIKPVTGSDSGPVITLGPNDVALYTSYAGAQGSVVPVANGEKITERQMLEAMMLPSANNMADSLAIWAFGSLSNYSAAANSYVRNLGLRGTHIGIDGSGFSPTTTSTASDLVKIGEQVMNNEVLASIVSQKQATDIPLVPLAKNVNYLLGTNNIVGLKTGNTDQAGGVYVSASKINLGSGITIITANLGSPTLPEAVNGSLPLILSSQQNVNNFSYLPKGNVVGQYFVPWENKSVNILTSENVSATAWGGSQIQPRINLANIKTSNINSTDNVGDIRLVGQGVISSNAVKLVLSEPINKPPILWRLMHP